MTFNKNRAGNIVYMVGGEIYHINAYGKMAYAGGAKSGVEAVVTLTGWNLVTESGNTMYQTTSGGFIDLMDGWQSRGTSTAYSVNSAQKYVNEIIANNKLILQNNLVCARFANKLTTQQRQTLRGLQSRLQARNESLLNSGMTYQAETSYPQGYAELGGYLTELMNTTDGIGVVVSGTAIIVVSCIVAASLATAAYFAYRYMAQESKDDVKYSKELTNILTSKLTPEEYEQLKDETAGIVTKARIKQSLSTLGNVGTFALLGAAGVMAYIIIKKIWNK